MSTIELSVARDSFNNEILEMKEANSERFGLLFEIFESEKYANNYFDMFLTEGNRFGLRFFVKPTSAQEPIIKYFPVIRYSRDNMIGELPGETVLTKEPLSLEGASKILANHLMYKFREKKNLFCK